MALPTFKFPDGTFEDGVNEKPISKELLEQYKNAEISLDDLIAFYKQFNAPTKEEAKLAPEEIKLMQILEAAKAALDMFRFMNNSVKDSQQVLWDMKEVPIEYKAKLHVKYAMMVSELAKMLQELESAVNS